MRDRPKILIVDDEQELRELLREALSLWECDAISVPSAAAALEALDGQLFDVALVDVVMPEMDGVALLSELKQRDADLDVIMITGRPTVQTAVSALKAGAYDYLEKPLNLDVLRHALDRLLERRALRREVTKLRARLGERLPARELVGSSPVMVELRALVAKVAATDSPALIEGESGTGKELVAAAIHAGSARHTAPFVAVNCGAIPGELMESQFFGHVRGAFSGAVADAPGLFRSAEGGTIFLDEVSEMPPALQVKLLRVLQDKEVRPVGSSRSQLVDVRVIAASNRPLADAVRAGAFRDDLRYRLDVVRIAVPPLRERKSDIPRLAAHFIRELNRRFHREVGGVSRGATAALMAHDFPGNVRELENLLERAYVLGARGEIAESDLPALAGSPPVAGPAATLPTMTEAERDLIALALQHYRGDKDRIAKALGISRRTLYRRLKAYGLDASPPAPGDA